MADTIKAVVDFSQVTSWMKRLKGKMDSETFMGLAANIMHEDVQQHFDRDKKSSSGKAWPSVKGKPRAKILIQTGDLRASIWKKVTSSNAEVGTNKEYAAIHNFGGKINNAFGKGITANVPQREFMWISDQAIGYIEKTVANALVE